MLKSFAVTNIYTVCHKDVNDDDSMYGHHRLLYELAQHYKKRYGGMTSITLNFL